MGVTPLFTLVYRYTFGTIYGTFRFFLRKNRERKAHLMPRGANKIREGIGELFGFSHKETATAHHEQTVVIEEADYTIQQDTPMPASIATMTPEALKARRIARIERASGLLQTPHVKIMLHVLDAIALIGPFYIMTMTTSELGELFTNGKPFSWQDQTSVNMYGAAFFGEAILLGLTFISQYIRSYEQSLSSDSPERLEIEKLSNGAIRVWWLFAAIGALGQAVYLYNYWHPAGNWIYYLLILGRVCIYTGGDYVAAKYLCYRIPTLKRTIMEEQERSKAYTGLEQVEAESRKREKEADAHMKNIDREIAQKDRRDAMIGNVEIKLSEATTKTVGRVTDLLDGIFVNALAEINQRLELPPPQEVESTKQKDSNEY